MLILAIDCAQRFCSVALLDAAQDRILASRSPDVVRGHAERLPGIVSEVLGAAGATLADTGRLAVAVGPGSFAGVRVGVAFVRGLALALSVPAVGVSTHLAMAGPLARSSNRPVMAAIDARRDAVWCAIVTPDGHFSLEPCELAPQAASRLARDSDCLMIGSAAELLAVGDRVLEERLSNHCIGHPEAPAIEDVARIAAMLDPAMAPPEPLYLREADARPQAGFALARAT